MAGFTADVTTPVNIPSVAPVAITNQGGGSVFQNAAALATFGLEVKARSNARSDEEARQVRVNNINTAVLAATDQISELTGQKELTSLDINKIVRQHGGNFVSASDRLAYQTAIGESLSSPLFKSIIGDDLDAVATTKKAIRSHSAGAISRGLNEMGLDDINEVPDDKVGELESRILSFEARLVEMKASKVKFSGSPSTKNYNEFASTMVNGSIDIVAEGLNNVISDLNSLDLNSPQLKETVQQIKQTISGTIDANISELQKVALQSKKGLTDDEQRRIVADMELAVKNLESVKTTFNTMNDAQFNNTLQIANELKNDRSINMSESFPNLLAMSEILGGNADLIMSKVLTESKAGKIASKVFASELDRGLLNTGRDLNIGTASELAQGMTLEGLNSIFRGGSVDEEALGDRKSSIADRWQWMNTFIKDPVSIQNFSEVQMDRFGISLIEVLKTAEEDGTESDVVNASALLSSKAFGSYMDKLAKSSPVEAETLTRYVASSTALTFEKQFRFDAEMKYDATIGGGKIQIPTRDPVRASKSTSTDPRTIQAERQTERQLEDANKQRIKKAIKANEKLDAAAATLAKHNPFLKGDVRAAKDYLMSFIPASQVTGFRQDFSSEEQSAVVNGVSKPDFEKGVDARQRLLDIQGDVEEISEASLARRVGFEAPSVDNTSDLDDEEFEELVKQMRAERSGK